jgi:hypothetical protein
MIFCESLSYVQILNSALKTYRFVQQVEMFWFRYLIPLNTLSQLYRPPLVGKVSANLFADRGCHMVTMTDPCGRILGFLDRSHYFFYQVAPPLYSESEWTPFQTHFSENLVAPGIEPGLLDV